MSRRHRAFSMSVRRLKSHLHSLAIYRWILLRDLAVKDKVWTRAITFSIDFIWKEACRWSATYQNWWAASQIRKVDEKHLECDTIWVWVDENGDRPSRQQDRPSQFWVIASATIWEGNSGHSPWLNAGHSLAERVEKIDERFARYLRRLWMNS